MFLNVFNICNIMLHLYRSNWTIRKTPSALFKIEDRGPEAFWFIVLSLAYALCKLSLT